MDLYHVLMKALNPNYVFLPKGNGTINYPEYWDDWSCCFEYGDLYDGFDDEVEEFDWWYNNWPELVGERFEHLPMQRPIGRQHHGVDYGRHPRREQKKKRHTSDGIEEIHRETSDSHGWHGRKPRRRRRECQGNVREVEPTHRRNSTRSNTSQPVWDYEKRLLQTNGIDTQFVEEQWSDDYMPAPYLDLMELDYEYLAIEQMCRATVWGNEDRQPHGWGDQDPVAAAERERELEWERTAYFYEDQRGYFER